MKETSIISVGLILAGSGTIFNLIIFVLSDLEFGFIGNTLYLLIPFVIGFSLIVYSMNKTLKLARLEKMR